MAHIVIDARNMNSSTGRYSQQLVHYLEKLDEVNTYTILLLEKDAAFYKPTNPQFSVMGVPFPWFSFGEQFAMARFLRSLKPDLVHFTMPHHSIFYRGDYITTFHDLILLNTYNSDKNFLIFKTKQFVGRFVYLAMAHRAKHLITPTKYVKNELVRFSKVTPEKITVTYEGAALVNVVPQQYDPLVGKQYLLYVGQQSDYKNVKRLMKAHQELRKKYPELLLVLVGRLSGKNGKPLQMNKSWAEKQQFSGILYTDFVPDEQLRWIMQHCRIYVFPSLMEGFGLPGLEAMAVGAAVASSNAASLPEVYGDAAYYFDPLNTDDMARALGQILKDDALRMQLIARGKQRVTQFSWKRMSEQTLAVYKNILNKKK